jgi:hypothetical protein
MINITYKQSLILVIVLEILFKSIFILRATLIPPNTPTSLPAGFSCGMRQAQKPGDPVSGRPITATQPLLMCRFAVFKPGMGYARREKPRVPEMERILAVS